MVCLQSPDKATFFVPWEVAMRSTVVKQMLEGEFWFGKISWKAPSFRSHFSCDYFITYWRFSDLPEPSEGSDEQPDPVPLMDRCKIMLYLWIFLLIMCIPILGAAIPKFWRKWSNIWQNIMSLTRRAHLKKTRMHGTKNMLKLRMRISSTWFW